MKLGSEWVLGEAVETCYLVILSMMVLSRSSEVAGSSFCTISFTNWSLMPGLALSASSNAFFNSSMASVLWPPSIRPLYWCLLCNWNINYTSWWKLSWLINSWHWLDSTLSLAIFWNSEISLSKLHRQKWLSYLSVAYCPFKLSKTKTEYGLWLHLACRLEFSIHSSSWWDDHDSPSSL